MKQFLKQTIAMISALYWRIHERNHLEIIAARWRLQGHPLPYAAAIEEIDLRAKLESFRDCASDRYLNERVTLEQIRKDWMEVLKPYAKVPGGTQDVSVLRSVIGDMPASEMLHAHAYAVWTEDCNRRRGAQTLSQPASMSPLHRRVLRT